LTGMDSADGVDEFLAEHVLEKVAAGAGLKER